MSNEFFQTLALSYNAVTEKPHFHKISFRVKGKIFATLEEDTQIAVLKLSKKAQESWINRCPPAVMPVKGKWGEKGWTQFDLNNIDKDSMSAALEMSYQLVVSDKQKNNPLHGVKLADILHYLVKDMGWKKMGQSIQIKCFTDNPSVKSSLTFLRKTPWARAKVEELYLKQLKKK